jgi:hypothetical protein
MAPSTAHHGNQAGAKPQLLTYAEASVVLKVSIRSGAESSRRKL